MWSKRKEQYTRQCHKKCGKNISAGEERFVKDTGDIVSYFYHLDCGEAEFRKYQSSIKDESDKCFSELRQLWNDLEPKVENEDLEVKDVKRINALKKEINRLLKTKSIKDFDLTYPTVEVDFDNLKKALTELDSFIKENASPRTIDMLIKARYQRIRDCSHQKGIEPCTDDPTFFCCSYCWDANSPEFLKQLRRWHVNNVNKLLDKHNINSINFAKNSSNYKRLLDEFTTQEELKQVYQALEKESRLFLEKNCGINVDDQRERERERAKLQQDITNLENKSNKTPEEEEELDQLKDKLKDLDKKSKNNPSTTSNSFNYTHWLIGAGCLLVFLILIIFIATRKKRKEV